MTTDVDRAETTPEQYYRAVFRDAADAILILDDQHAIVEANPAAGALVGVRASTLIGRVFDDLLVDGADQMPGVWRELMAAGEAKHEHHVASPAGSRIVECSYRARVQPHRHLCIARDISDRRLLEARLLQTEKIESIGRLAGGVAHDFNNLLTAILGYTELLLSSRPADDPDRVDLEEIQKAGQRAAALTKQLLAFSRKQALKPKEVDLNRTVAGLQSMLGRLIREDITLTCALAPTPTLVLVDPHQIEQVILNLVLNARDALPVGGDIRIEVCRVSASQVEMPPEQPPAPGEYARLRVIDDGVGLSADARAHLFEPFFTTKEFGKGSGLGLASAYGVVRQSNGLMSVESEPGLGATFTMYFPLVPAAEGGDTSAALAPELVTSAEDGGTPAAHTAQPATGRETILLVEDEDAVRSIISALLRRYGYHVLEASTAAAACEISAGHAGTIDLLLSDVVMPGMSGPALAQRLVDSRPELRVLFISGYVHLAASSIDHGSPNRSFLSKPFQASALAEKVRDLLARPRQTS